MPSKIPTSVAGDRRTPFPLHVVTSCEAWNPGGYVRSALDLGFQVLVENTIEPDSGDVCWRARVLSCAARHLIEGDTVAVWPHDGLTLAERRFPFLDELTSVFIEPHWASHRGRMHAVWVEDETDSISELRLVLERFEEPPPVAYWGED